MPALAFGLKAVKPPTRSAKSSAKGKALFNSATEDQDDDCGDDGNNTFNNLASKSKPSGLKRAAPVDSGSRPVKSPKLDEEKNGSKYSNLSSLRNAKLQDAETSKLDPTVYDYDSMYDTFSASTGKKASATEKSSEVPKYMNNLLASAETRKRDQLRAKERALQREREAEGDEFADKEKFVTTAYKKQQEEVKRMEEEERQRAEAEEERRRKGGGMTGFYKNVLAKDEENVKAMQKAMEEVKHKQEHGMEEIDQESEEQEKSEANVAAEVNERSSHIVTNDEGEIVDKRQLLSAGLNVASQKSRTTTADNKAETNRPQEWHRSVKAQDARMAQRERQSRMVEQQIAQLAEQQKQVDSEEERAREEKNKSRVTESDKLSAKERYLQRKREREEQKNQAAGAG